jgi:hypothetical protein
LNSFDARGGAGGAPAGVPTPDTAKAFKALVSGITGGDAPHTGGLDMTPYWAPKDHADSYDGPGGTKGASARHQLALDAKGLLINN